MLVGAILEIGKIKPELSEILLQAIGMICHLATNLEVIRKFLSVELTQEAAHTRNHVYTMICS